MCASDEANEANNYSFNTAIKLKNQCYFMIEKILTYNRVIIGLYYVQFAFKIYV